MILEGMIELPWILKSTEIAVFIASIPLAAQSPVEAGRAVYRANYYACHGPEGVTLKGPFRRHCRVCGSASRPVVDAEPKALIVLASPEIIVFPL
jgi:hypothetical protein